MKKSNEYILFNNNIKVMLKSRRLTQTDLGTKLGISRSSVSNKLNGWQSWSVKEIKSIAKMLNTSIGTLANNQIVPAIGLTLPDIK